MFPMPSRGRWRAALFQCLPIFLVAAAYSATIPGIERDLHVKIAMRDGVHLSANIFRPRRAAFPRC